MVVGQPLGLHQMAGLEGVQRVPVVLPEGVVHSLDAVEPVAVQEVLPIVELRRPFLFNVYKLDSKRVPGTTIPGLCHDDGARLKNPACGFGWSFGFSHFLGPTVNFSRM